MLISIHSVSVEPLEMCAEAVDALTPRAGNWKAEVLFKSLASYMHLKEIKFTLDLVLPLSFPLEPGQTWTVSLS